MSRDDYLSKSMTKSPTTAVHVVVVIFCVLLSLGASVVGFAGTIAIFLKLFSVEPVASWTWGQVFLPWMAAFGAWAFAKIVVKAFE